MIVVIIIILCNKNCNFKDYFKMNNNSKYIFNNIIQSLRDDYRNQLCFCKTLTDLIPSYISQKFIAW